MEDNGQNKKKPPLKYPRTTFFVCYGFFVFMVFCHTKLDAPVSWQIGFQDPATPVIIGIIKFHSYLISILIGVATFVFWIVTRALILYIPNKHPVKDFNQHTLLEITWTVVPAIILLFIIGPSFALLYSIEVELEHHIFVKIIGHQWYWSYEYGSHIQKSTGKYLKFDSYITHEEDLTFGSLRLLEVDYRIKLPVNKKILLLITSGDVLHSWSVPSLGVKVDACPGRLNQVSVHLLRTGVFYGQCSEICGINHGFIPIVVEGIDEVEYRNWVYKGILKQ